MAISNIQEYQEMNTIFVRNLDKKISESELYKIIDDVSKNNIFTVSIRKDQQHETSLAYIKMKTHEAAKELIQKMNGEVINNKVIQMSWSMSHPSKIFQNESNLIFKSIKKDITLTQLHEIFGKYGDIFSLKLSKNEKGMSNGFGYVKYVRIEDSEKVFSVQNEIKEMIGEEKFCIEKYDKPQKTDKTNLYVTNIDPNITEEQFIKYFETFGPIRRNNITGKYLVAFFFVEKIGKKKGFVNFETAEAAINAINSPKENVLGESELSIDYYKSKAERKREYKMKDMEIKKMISTQYKNFNMYVRTTRESITSDEVKREYADCGNIYSLKIKYQPEVQQDAVFYICMTNKEDKEKVVAKSKELGWAVFDFKSRNEIVHNTPQINMNNVPYINQFMGMPQVLQHGAPMNYNHQSFAAIFSAIVNMGFMQQPFPQQMNTQVRPQKVNKVGKQNGSVKGQRQPNKMQQKQSRLQHHEPVGKDLKKEEKEEKRGEVDEDARNELGDSLYDYITEKHKFDEDLTGRITGVLLESIDYWSLYDKYHVPSKDELDKIIREIKENLETMGSNEQQGN